MRLRLNLLGLLRSSAFFAMALLVFNSAIGQSVQEHEASQTKEMRQMWQNVVKQRARRQVKITPPAQLNSKTSANGQDRKSETVRRR